MGSILNKSNTLDTIIYPESSVNETVLEPTNETVLDIVVEAPEIEKPIERANESELIKKLEQDAYDKLKGLDKALPSDPTNKYIGDALINIMQSGSDEFEEKTGRKMTYAEMRAAWG
jgi:hypothetical protein